ncbi:MAG: hypothetical protein ACE5H9_06875 [Anaerolineae bacterium]
MMDDVEKILEGLSQEDRLKLLESLIQGATQAREENLSVEERLERLEQLILGKPWAAHGARVVHIECGPGFAHHAGGMGHSCHC